MQVCIHTVLLWTLLTQLLACMKECSIHFHGYKNSISGAMLYRCYISGCVIPWPVLVYIHTTTDICFSIIISLISLNNPTHTQHTVFTIVVEQFKLAVKLVSISLCSLCHVLERCAALRVARVIIVNSLSLLPVTDICHSMLEHT